MSVPLAYLGVVIIWSTTPLAVKWSADGPGFLFAAGSRMLLGATLCLLILKSLGISLPWNRAARRTYLAASLGIYGAMLSVYWGAQFIPSGFIAVLFGLSPLITSVMAAVWLDERSLGPAKLGGMILGLVGLGLVFNASLRLTADAVYGVAAVLLASVLHSASGVWVKRTGTELPALSLAAGGMLVAVPMYALTWLASGAGLPAAIPMRAGLSIAYLSVFGSVIGFVLYFYALRRLPVSTMALVTMITPVAALFMGKLLNDEPIGPLVWLGAASIAAGLALHHWAPVLRRLGRALQL